MKGERVERTRGKREKQKQLRTGTYLVTDVHVPYQEGITRQQTAAP